MTIEYKVVQIKTPIKKEGEDHLFYPRVCNREKINLRDMAKRIASISTFSEIDVQGVLTAFVTEIPYFLLDNHSVELGELGTFSLHITGKGVQKPEQINTRNIHTVKMAFRPGTRIKEELKKAEFKKRRK
ncbi:HU family DNA-binding protein [Ancylomarina longa]|uniref:HU domain-containing protein n=1 Tax=Ancylomarina longa TaxID=2487017 RepID=A0A434AUJ7_9BACT|nr:HU family DNA-binding protein [Ancylomarina longa]RUT78105.1 hypothetical protein DLK05_09670 [Ancylomarina longa]